MVEFIETTTFSVAVISTSSMSATLITFGTAPFLYTINLRIRISWTYFPIFLANFFNSSEIWIVWGQTFSQGLHPIQHSPQKTLCKYPGNSVRTIQRWRKNGTADKRKGSERKIPRKIKPERTPENLPGTRFELAWWNHLDLNQARLPIPPTGQKLL